MNPTVGKEKNIFVRKLSTRDRRMLAALRETYATDFNTVAVMAACYDHGTLLAKIRELQKAKDKLEKSLDALTKEKAKLHAQILNFFSLDRLKMEKKRQLIEMATNSKLDRQIGEYFNLEKKQSAKGRALEKSSQIPRKNKGKGLSYLLKK